MTGFDFVSPQFSASSLTDTVFVSRKTARTVTCFAFFFGGFLLNRLNMIYIHRDPRGSPRAK